MVLPKPSCSNHTQTHTFTIFQYFKLKLFPSIFIKSLDGLEFTITQNCFLVNSETYNTHLYYHSFLCQHTTCTHSLTRSRPIPHSPHTACFLPFFQCPLSSPPSLASLNPRAHKVNCLSISSFSSPQPLSFPCLLYKLSSLCSPVQHLGPNVLLQKPPNSYVFFILKMLFNETS